MSDNPLRLITPLALFLWLISHGVLALGQEEASPGMSQKAYDHLVVEHKKLVSEHLDLSQDEAKRFWPVYEVYRREIHKIIKQRIAYVSDLADKYDAMDDDLSLSFIDHFRKVDHGYDALWEEFMPKFIEILGARKTARFYQIERRIRIYLDAEMSRALPLIR
jgi:hypothetical protein